MKMENKALVFRINDNGIGPELLHQVFLEKGWLEYDEEKHDESDWNIWWKTSRFRTSDYNQINPWQRLNHYPNSVGITRKDFLARTLKRMKGVYGSGVYNFSPLAFNVPNDYTKFVAEYSKLKGTENNKSLLWICKPVDMSRGRGIFLFRELSELQYDCSAIIQQYVSNPFLIAGYKFDIRIYVAVPSFHPLTVYIHQEGLVRFSTEKFDLNSINNIFAHLTNTSINKHSPSYMCDKERVGPGCKWTLLQLRYYFHQKGINDQKLWLRIINIVILTLITQAPSVPKVDNCFELYGFDILVDENLKPWLLEVNFSPALASDCQADVLVKKPLLHDLMEMLNFKSTDAERGAHCSESQHANKNISNTSSFTSHNHSQRHTGRNISDTSKRQTVMQGKGQANTQNESGCCKTTDSELPICGLPLVYHSEDDDIEERLAPTADVIKTDFAEESFGSLFCDELGKALKSERTESTVMSHAETAKSQTKCSASSRRLSKTKSCCLLQKGHNKSSTVSDKGISSFSEIYNDCYKSDSEISLPNTVTSNPAIMSSLYGNSTQNDSKHVPFHWQKLKRIPGQPALARLAKSPLKVKSSYLKASIKKDKQPVVTGFIQEQDQNDTPILNKLATGKKKQKKCDHTLHLPRVSPIKISNPKLVVSGQSKMNGSHKPYLTASKNKFVNTTASTPKEIPKRIGEFYLVFPFNEATKNASQPVLDIRVIIRETQKLIRESANSKSQGQTEEQLWGPLKTT